MSAPKISDARLAEVQSFHEDLRNLMASRHQLKEAFMADDVVQLCRELQQLRRERQSLDAQEAIDARRYRWLRSRSGNNRLPHIDQYPRQWFDTGDIIQVVDENGLNPVKLDAAIDAAMLPASPAR